MYLQEVDVIYQLEVQYCINTCSNRLCFLALCYFAKFCQSKPEQHQDYTTTILIP